MGGLSIWHWLIVLAVVLILFGSGRVGSLLGELGKGVKSFKQNVSETPGALPRDASMLDSGAPVDPVTVERGKSSVRNG
jgi:sec-independent protein translocase protein TatA